MAQLLFLGDSLIASYDWQDRIPFHRVQSIAIPGAKVKELFDIVSNNTNIYQPDLIHICIGTNNVYYNDFEFLTTLRELIISLQQRFPLAEIMISNIFPMQRDHIAPKDIVQINHHIEEFTKQTGNCLLDMHKVFSEYSTDSIFLADNIHLTEQGYALWARSILEHIAFLIEPD